MTCGTAPSCQQCSGGSKVVLQCLINSGGIPSLPGALPEAKLSMALLSSSTDGSESNSSMIGRHSMTFMAAPCGRHGILSGVEVRIVFHRSPICWPLSVIIAPLDDLTSQSSPPVITSQSHIISTQSSPPCRHHSATTISTQSSSPHHHQSPTNNTNTIIIPATTSQPQIMTIQSPPLSSSVSHKLCQHNHHPCHHQSSTNNINTIITPVIISQAQIMSLQSSPM